MAVIRNTFSGTLDSVTVENYTITGLTSPTSTTAVGSVSPEVTLHFLRNLYQTLLDAGYNDTVLDEEDYSITVLGFKFFVPCYRYSVTYGIFPKVYCYGSIDDYSYPNTQGATSYSHCSITDVVTNTNLEYNITVRGDKNCVCICYGTYKTPLATTPLIFIAKAKNLITSENMYFYTGRLDSASSTSADIYKRFRKADDLYSEIKLNDTSTSYSGKSQFATYYDYTGYQTASKFVVEPVLGYHGSILIHSMIMCNDVNFINGNFYKIGADLYYCNGYIAPNLTPYTNRGQFALYKVSD